MPNNEFASQPVMIGAMNQVAEIDEDFRPRRSRRGTPDEEEVDQTPDPDPDPDPEDDPEDTTPDTLPDEGDDDDEDDE
mgnify:CR=1 FL=1